jgi:hypothetical protein
MKRLWMLLLAALFVFTLSAADIAGNWKASVQGPDGSMEITFTFKVDGGKITGTSTSQMGEMPLSEIKVDGDNVSFVVAMQDMKILHKGTISGSEMKLDVTFAGMDQTMQITAKKQ